ncbi:hypothetical protein O3P69_008370 [Scylla paramamosain]|uniref:G-protein coupled receptors family 1 profile domain-containing protein n=2 Tax=Scylla paramamosain TaxID=85552 RepID=A0AAW0SJA5_SCYPA
MTSSDQSLSCSEVVNCSMTQLTPRLASTMAEVDAVHWVVYRNVLPVLVFAGIILNVLCLVVLSRPSLRSTRVVWYFLALASSDLLVCVFHIPVITTITGCTFSSYGEAYYFTHFGWTMIGVCQSFGTYVIVWLSLDRFIAVWMYEIYPKIQQRPHVKRNRLLATAMACITFHLVYMVLADLTCSTEDEGDEECTRGHWISVSGYQYQFEKTWHKVYCVIYGLFIRWFPGCLLIFFNASLVVGIVQGRVNLPVGIKTPGRSGERKLVIITIAITASYILFTFPIMIYITGFAEALPDRCGGNHPKEVLRAVGNTLQLLEHVIHIAFLVGLNSRFRKELKILLRLEKRADDDYCHEQDGEKEEPKSRSKLAPPHSFNTHSTTPTPPTLTQDLSLSTADVAVL